jgi:DNA polymerase
MFVGEQPGDVEDRQGRPFVGPAGIVLADAFRDAGILRDDSYVTNAVKHFRWTATPTRRLHRRPGVEHLRACRPWLDAEVAAVRPRVLVCLGAVAAHAVFGKSVGVSASRGRFHRTTACARTMVTTHPSAVLRQPSPAERERAFRELVVDLRCARERAAEPDEESDDARISTQEEERWIGNARNSSTF